MYLFICISFHTRVIVIFKINYFRYPSLILYTIRWLLPLDLQREYYPAIVEIGSSLNISNALLYTVGFYSIWQILYYAFIVYGRRDKIARGLRATSYTYLLSDKNGVVAVLAQKFGFGEPGDGITSSRILFYYLLQFGYMFASILPVCLWYYRNM